MIKDIRKFNLAFAISGLPAEIYEPGNNCIYVREESEKEWQLYELKLSLEQAERICEGLHKEFPRWEAAVFAKDNLPELRRDY